MLRNIITRNLVSVTPDARLSEVARLMSDRNVGSVLVLDGGKPVGIITDRDLTLGCLQSGVFADHDVAKFLGKNRQTLATVSETDGIYDCIRKMREAKVRRIPVVDERGSVVSVLSFGDLLSLLSRELGELAEVASPEIPASESGKKKIIAA